MDDIGRSAATNALRIRCGSEAMRASSLGLVILLCGGLAWSPAAAEEGGEGRASEPRLVVPLSEGPPAGEGANGPGLDALLHVPSDYLAPRGRTVAGAGEQEWRRRFERAHDKLRRAQTALDETKQALDVAAEGGGSSQWAMAPPGVSNSGGPTNSPLSFRLRQDLLRHREDLEGAERALRELRIEADLVGVPVDWRGDHDVPLGKRLPDSPYYN